MNNSSAKTGTIRLRDRFDFSCYKAFAAQYEPMLVDNDIAGVEINFADVEYIDSSAIGMLMLLREKLDSVGKTLRVTQARGMVRDIMLVANLQKRMPID